MITDLLEYLKVNLNIESGYTEENTYLQQLLDISQLVIINELSLETGTTLSSLGDVVTHAVILFATHLYTNRNIITFAQPYQLPLSFKYLLAPYKNYVVV